VICLLKHYGIICLFRTVDVTGISSLNVSTVESVSVTLNPEFGVYAGDISSDSLSEDSEYDEIR
jgi:uncharacterized membrane protein YczE